MLQAKHSIIRGNFSGADAAYEVVERVISELEELGFSLKEIHTAGETSAHDWTWGYKKSYPSFEEFSRHAEADYQEACCARQAGGPAPDWGSTYFELTDHRLPVTLYVCYDEMHTVYRFGWAVLIPEGMTADDELLTKIQDVLRKYE